MNILIICTYYPPDSAIAAKRPYALAKYLKKLGNNVVVLRSGEIDRVPNRFPSNETDGVKVISFLGVNCDAERFERGEPIIREQRPFLFPNIPSKFRTVLVNFKNLAYSPILSIREIISAKKNFALQRSVIDNLSAEGIDIVFSTYADLENIYAGQYAAKKLNAKWIMDFRDPVVSLHDPFNLVWNLYASVIQSKAIKDADLCTCVSYGLQDELQKKNKNAKIITLYNGYDNNSIPKDPVPGDKFTLCYTGVLYDKRITALESLLIALRDLIVEGSIQREKVLFKYAGNTSMQVGHLFEKYNLKDILEDNGFVSSLDAQMIQNSSDIFLVLSWNTKKSQGVLTGKFYEGIRAEIPILAVVSGDVPNSELYQLNNKYHYGFCFECCKEKTQYNDLKAFILRMYQEKIDKIPKTFSIDEKLKEDFHYSNIAKKLQGLMADIIRDKEDL